MTLRIPDPPQSLVEPNQPNNPDGEDLRLATELWIAQCPRLYIEIETRALQMAHQGMPFALKPIVEQLRWEWRHKQDSTGEFFLNNNYTAYLARAIVARNPWVAPMLRFRKTRY